MNLKKEMDKPVRVQRKRTKGWKMPENTVSVTRPGKWGNIFTVGGLFKVGNGNRNGGFILIKDAEQAVEMYQDYLNKYPPRDIEQLRGKNLACFCSLDAPCHADVLLKLANS